MVANWQKYVRRGFYFLADVAHEAPNLNYSKSSATCNPSISIDLKSTEWYDLESVIE